MTQPLVSVVTPAYNAEEFISEAIASVRAQTYAEWELIVVDDGSMDGTAAVAERFRDSRMRLVRAVHSGLPAVGRNRGIAESSGEYVAFLDADDAWLPEKLERQVVVLSARPEVGLVHCAASYLGEPPLPAALDVASDETLSRLLRGNYIFNSSVMVRRSVLDEHGLFDTDPLLRGSEDYELWLRLARDVEFSYVPDPLVLYRRHDGGLSAHREQMDLGFALAVDKALRRSPSLDALRDPAHDRNLGIALCLARAGSSGRTELWRAVKRRPGDLVAWKWLALTLIGGRMVRRLRAWHIV